MMNGNMNTALYKSAVSVSSTLSISSALLLMSTDTDKPYLLSNPLVLSILLAGSLLALTASVRYSYNRGHRMRQKWMQYDNNNPQGTWQEKTPSNDDSDAEWTKRQYDGLAISMLASIFFIATAAYAIDIGRDSLDSNLDKGIFGTLFGFVAMMGLAMAAEAYYTLQCNDIEHPQPKSNVLAKLPDTVYSMSIADEYSEYTAGELYIMRFVSGLAGAVSLLGLYTVSLNPGDAGSPLLDSQTPTIFRLFFAGLLFLSWGVQQYSYVLKEFKEGNNQQETPTKKTSFLGPSSVSFGLSAACFLGMIITATVKKVAESSASVSPDISDIASFAGVYAVGGGALIISSLFMARHSHERAKDVPAGRPGMVIN